MKLSLRILFLLVFGLFLGQLSAAGGGEEGEEYDLVGTAMHHIADANEFHIVGDFSIPLPVILYAPGHGWTFGMSNMFHHGTEAVDGYVLNHGRVNRIADASFPMGHVALAGGDHGGHDDHGDDHAGDEHAEEAGHEEEAAHDAHHLVHHKMMEVDGKEKEVAYITYEGKEYLLDPPSTLDGGLVGGGITSFYDFSITKNVATMILAMILLIVVWTSVKNRYQKNEGKAPSGLQSLMEPLFVFVQEEVSKPMIGEKHYARFQPFIMCLFFFILFCNLLGLIPFFPGSANVTGNIAVTLVLAVIVFIVTNLNGNRHYWGHIFAMPGVPKFVLIILTPVEILGLFIKPFSLMIRLFANISAGHIIILSLIGLIFVFGESGQNVGGAAVGVLVGGLFTAFMNLIELLVAFLQAFIFSILAASYIGAAVEEHDHGHDDHHAEETHGYAAAVQHQPIDQPSVATNG
ncbi:F0F1 ATP synthase subunit A [Lewinella sp. W8]|uniref:F0F1 ATP synthase subunit A n=1 Tax=Lewinella sp. W8 TaxID=2528208 RepID=UPI0010679F19|nr:F0F1 ATP synthase subunit A [Lewinella sp. W8]MTB53305.1 F0F1 ATP synthase subunit A [Lewinella sp. W8]